MNEFEENSIATDEDYYQLSDQVYDDDYLEVGAKIEGSNGKVWRVIECIDTNKTDKTEEKNGLQAIAVVPAKDYDPSRTQYDEIIYSFRGTEFGKFDGDLSTDIDQITLGMKEKWGVVGGEIQKFPTSFDSALEFVDKVNKKYEPTSVHTTGHSKGAAEAQYVAAERNCHTTTYAAPNVYRLLSDEAKKRVDQGLMENKATDFTHKKDAVGNFEQFGAKPIGKQFLVESNGTSHGLLGLLFMGEHPMDTFEGMFHSDGRAILESKSDGVIQQAKGTEIQLKVEDIKQIARDLKNEIEDINQKITEASQKIINVLHQSPASVDGNLINTITYAVYGFQRGYMEPLHSVADFIDQKANEFERVDNQG
ncbi:cytoplasmic protein [Bacillus pseudomycoides]|uniref:cytoplasmic protein n=1 Tax=Bacillus pseudomycoides TaxID=64104 RepID=UPI001FB3013E|nr:cytoplasmic protein [Bacillus pseudomycoides]